MDEDSTVDETINDNDFITEVDDPTVDEEPDQGVGHAEMAVSDPGESCDSNRVSRQLCRKPQVIVHEAVSLRVLTCMNYQEMMKI